MESYFIALKRRLSYLRCPYDRNEKFIKFSDPKIVSQEKTS